jgi:hypothetical protein
VFRCALVQHTRHEHASTLKLDLGGVGPTSLQGGAVAALRKPPSMSTRRRVREPFRDMLLAIVLYVHLSAPNWSIGSAYPWNIFPASKVARVRADWPHEAEEASPSLPDPLREVLPLVQVLRDDSLQVFEVVSPVYSSEMIRRRRAKPCVL